MASFLTNSNSTTEKKLEALEQQLRDAQSDLQTLRSNSLQTESELKAFRDKEIHHLKSSIQKIKASSSKLESTQYQFISSYEKESSEVQKLLVSLYHQKQQQQAANPSYYNCNNNEEEKVGLIKSKKTAKGMTSTKQAAIVVVESTPLESRMEYRKDPHGFASCLDDEDDSDDEDPNAKELFDDEDLAARQAIEEDDGKMEIPPDTYGFIMLARYEWSRRFIPVFVAWFVVAFQVLTFMVVLINMMDPGNENGNYFSFPQNVDSSTRMAEVLAIIIGVAIEEDTRTAIILWYDGYDTITYTTPPGTRVTKFNWRCSVYTRLFLGLFDIFISFLLIMSSDQVVDMLMNFAAVQFVSFLDDVAFSLSEEGFLGSQCKQMTYIVHKSYYEYNPIIPTTTTHGTSQGTVQLRSAVTSNSSKLRRSSGFRILLFVSVLVPLFVGWAIILTAQYAAEYSCKQIYIQFGDNVRPELSALSGHYRYVPRNGQVDYILVQENNPSQSAVLAFCKDDGIWTLSIFDTTSSSSSLGRIDPCNDYIVKSSENEDLWNDVTATADSTWFVVQKSTGKEIILDYLRLFCSECNKDFCGDHGSCTSVGAKDHKGVNDKELGDCVCDDGWYGLRCDYIEPCSKLALNELFGEFDGFREWPQTYERLSLVSSSSSTNDNNGQISILQHPVYYSSFRSNEMDIIIFTGRRWILTSSSLLKDFPQTTMVSKETMMEYLNNEFHPYWSKYEYGFISETVDLDTSSDQISPQDLSWYQVPAATTLETALFVYPSEAKLLCSICHDRFNPCLSNGICNPSDGTCDCSASGAKGILCQLAPLKNGFCNPTFNVAEYDFDGGDCCQATCVSKEITCGRQENNQYIGYCHCVDPDFTECPETDSNPNALSSSSCWLPMTVSIPGETAGARSGSSIAVSNDATVLAVGEPGTDSVRVLENDGSQWIPLGETIREQPGSGFGANVALSPHGNLLVVSAPYYTNVEVSDTTGNIGIYELSGNTWQKREEVPRTEGTMPANVPTDITYHPEFSFHGNVLYVKLQDSGQEKVFGFSKDPQTGKFFFPQDPSPQLPSPAMENRTGNLSSVVPSSETITTTPLSLVLSPLQAVGSDFTLGAFLSASSSGHVVAFDGKDARYNDLDQVVITRYELDNNDEKDDNGKYKFQPIGILDGCCCLLSGDGLVVVILRRQQGAASTPPLSEVYAYTNSSDWIKRGNSFNGTAKAISYDGSTLAVMQGRSDISTYLWNGVEWNYQGSVTGGQGSRVVLSGAKDGGGETKMVVGMPLDNVMGPNTGQTFIYKLHPNNNNEEEEQETCDRRNSVVRVEITMDAYPTETIWEIRDRFTKRMIWSGGPYDSEDQYQVFVNETLELPEDVICAEFSIFDIAGDGLCCGKGFGSYNLYYGGLLEKSGGAFDWLESHRFGNCERLCGEGKSYAKIEITLDDHPEETTFEVKDVASGNTGVRGGPFLPEQAGMTMARDVCVPSSYCIEFTIFDENGICCSSGYGSYTLSWDDDVTQKRGDFSKQASARIGSCEDISTAEVTGPLFQTLSINVILPENTGWTLYEIGSENATSGNYSMDIDFESRRCYLFEYLDFEKRNGGPRTGRFSLSVASSDLVPFNTYASGASFLIGNCFNVTTYFTLPKGDTITCSNDPINVCVSPAACAYGGIALTAVGSEESMIGSTLMNNEWTTNGAYSLKFGSDCEVTCSGTCNAVPTPPYQCGEGERLLRVQLHFLDPEDSYLRMLLKNITYWNIGSLEGETFLEGGLFQNGEIVNERACIPEDTCVMFWVLGYMRYIFFIDGKLFVNSAAKYFWEPDYNENLVGATELICPYLIDASSSSNELASPSGLGPWRSDQLCSIGAQQVSLDTNVSGSTINATMQIAPRCGKTSGSISPGVWYSIKGNGGRLVASLDAPFRNDTQISIFSGSCDMLVCVAGNDDSAIWGDIFYDPDLGGGGSYFGYGELRSSVVWNTIAGTVYYILVNGVGYLPVFYTLEIYVPEPPLNDECTGAVALVVDGSTDFNDVDSDHTYFATMDSVNACGGAMDSGSAGVWYSVTGTGKRMVASTCGSEFDTQVSVFSGTCGRLECIDGNDDFCSDSGSRVEWESRFGIEYLILINGKRAEDAGAFSLYAGNYPENDECNGAIGLILEQERFFSTVLATEDEFLASCGGTQLSQSYGMWFFTVGTGRDMNATLCGSSFDTQISVYSGTCGNLNCEAGNDDFCDTQSAVLWRSKLNTDYYIYVNGFGSSSGDFRILVTGADDDGDE